MRILYTPVGDTDPIRGCYDGGMLHIVRHYNPDLAILVLSKDMEQKEAANQRFTKALKHVKADLDIKLIHTGLEDVHRIDTLQPFVDHFYEMLAEYPEAEILINLSSGTPQMKLIMSYLSVEHDVVLIAQSPPLMMTKILKLLLKITLMIKMTVKTDAMNQKWGISSVIILNKLFIRSLVAINTKRL